MGQERKQLEGRKFFWIGQRRKILRKSNGFCAHCGKGLSLKEFTPDHVIPLSKGGTNDLKNIVPLCESCNKKKSNYIINPEDWYPYLNEKSKEEVLKYYSWYQKEFDYITFKNFTREDIFKAKGFNREERRKYKVSPILQIVRKLDINKNREEVEKFFNSYAKKINRVDTVDWDLVEGLFRENGVYGIKLGDDIVSIIAIRVGSPDVGIVAPVFFIYSLYKKYTKDILNLIDLVSSNLYSGSRDLENSEQSVVVMLYREDPIGEDLSKVLRVDGGFVYEKYNKYVDIYIRRIIVNETGSKSIQNGLVNNFYNELEKVCVPELKNYSKLISCKNTLYERIKIQTRVFIESLKICLNTEKLRKKRFSFANAIVYNIFGADYWKDEVIRYRANVAKVLLIILFILTWFGVASLLVSRLAFKF